MKKNVIFLMLVLVAIGLVPQAAAMDCPDPCPSPGAGFGQHVAGMAPDCAKMFGKMVSSMATGLDCPMS